jgi:ribosomal protein L17
MKKRVQKKKMGVKASHRKSLKRNLLTTLIESGKVKTTTVKAKVLRS